MEKITVFFTDKYNGCSSHMLLDEAIFRHSGMSGLKLSRTANGKPYFDAAGAPKFSISHSDNIWICAVADCNVGCDVQMHKSVPRFLKIAERYFHPDERNLLLRSSLPETSFFEVWAKKEAISKLRGDGINANFKNINTLSDITEERVTNLALPIPSPYSAAVACYNNFEYNITLL